MLGFLVDLASRPSLLGLYFVAAPVPSVSLCDGWGPRPFGPYAELPLCTLPSGTDVLPW